MLVYRCESPDYTVSLVVERTSPRLTARSLSFLRIDRDALNCHYELIFTVEEARTQRLSFTLPAATPASVSIVGSTAEAQGIHERTGCTVQGGQSRFC